MWNNIFLFWKRNNKVIRECKVNLIKYILIYVFAGTKSYRNETWRCKCCIILLMKIWIPPKSDILKLLWGLTYNYQFGEYNKIFWRPKPKKYSQQMWPRSIIMSIKPRKKTCSFEGTLDDLMLNNAKYRGQIWCQVSNFKVNI